MIAIGLCRFLVLFLSPLFTSPVPHTQNLEKGTNASHYKTKDHIITVYHLPCLSQLHSLSYSASSTVRILAHQLLY